MYSQSKDVMIITGFVVMIGMNLFLSAGFLLGWICVSDQLDSSPCLGPHGDWKIFTQDLCCILLCKYKLYCNCYIEPVLKITIVPYL